jgi:hypothetical protein
MQLHLASAIDGGGSAPLHVLGEERHELDEFEALNGIEVPKDLEDLLCAGGASDIDSSSRKVTQTCRT